MTTIVLATLDYDSAQQLVRILFGDSAYVTGSLAYGGSIYAQDIDFIVSKSVWNAIKYAHNLEWYESDYFPESSFKTVMFGMTFNAIILSDDEARVWIKATEAYRKAPEPMRTTDKTERIKRFVFFKSIVE